LICFSIGKYVDKILFDVVPMRASHLLLGRPWQHDRDVAHSRQVESLMEKKGWVREILSPCAMPIILVNQPLSQLLRYVAGKNLKAWKECLPHADFSYNIG